MQTDMHDGPRDIASLLAARGAGDRTRPALTFYQGRSRVESMTYDDLLRRVHAAASRLRTEHAIARGDRVAVLSPNRPEVPILFLATMSLGATVVPLNPTSPQSEWAYVLGHAAPRGVLVSRDFEAKLPPLAEGTFVRPIDEIANAEDAAGDVAFDTSVDMSGERAIILYTSGTTGAPKGVALSQGNLVSNGASMARNFGLDHATQLAVLPLYHAHALGFGLMSALTTSGHLVFTEKLDPFAWSEIIRSESVTMTSVVPTLLPALLAARVKHDKIPTLRAILVSSAPLTVELAREFEDKTELPLVQGWGLSEYTNFACCMSPDESKGDHARMLFGAEVPTIGSPLPGTEVRVVDLEGAPLGAGERGELQVRGPSRMLGYFGDEAATRNTLTDDGWLKTGDVGYFVFDRGAPIFFISGRIKEIIIRGAEKHSPIALERSILAGVPELAGKMVVLGFPHKVHGEEIGAYVEMETLDDELRARLAAAVDALAPDLRPKIVLHGAAPIPRTHTGKIQRRKLLPFFEAYATCRGAAKIAPV